LLAIDGAVTCTRFVVFVLGAMLLPIASAAAQEEPSEATVKNRFALGAEFKVKTSDRASQEDYAKGQLGPGLLWRFGKGKEGWGFHWGLNWYAVKIERPIGGTAIELGELHVRPVMAGWGYTKIIHRYSVTADVLGGYAIGSIDISDPANLAYQRVLGVPPVEAHAGNTFVLKPEIGVWYDITKKVFLNFNAGYMVARPEVEIVTASGRDVRTARADQFIVKVGLVYSIF
jgi:hypothetical protein